MKIIFVSLTTAVISLGANAGPVIESVDIGAGQANQTVISGTGFGEFDGDILSWDDFEHHDVGVPFPSEDPVEGFSWSTIYGYEGQGMVVDSARSVSGQKAIKIEWGKDSNTIRAFGWEDKGPYDKLYITYWRYMEGNYNASENHNHKQFYLYGNKDGFPQLMPLIPAGTTTWGVYNNVGKGDVSWSKRNNVNTAGWSWDNTKNKFQRWEVYTELNEPYTESNAVIEVRVDGRLGIQNDSYRTRDVNGEFTDFRLGHMAQGFTETAKAWFDDVYIATTRARVEVCDSNQYDKCTIKHIQRVKASDWNNNEIGVSLRNLQFYRTGPVFIYVIDSEGQVSNAVPVPRPVMAPLSLTSNGP